MRDSIFESRFFKTWNLPVGVFIEYERDSKEHLFYNPLTHRTRFLNVVYRYPWKALAPVARGQTLTSIVGLTRLRFWSPATLASGEP